ncbi:hypothetical protein Sm713_29800 [Streptomyces sp. TS71-3]|nr:hypothetical protein Sm713_29800 [Streptomyces sp. TS71-3]
MAGTGGSKGGMTATYFERFYPHDMDGVVAYVAPNDVVNDEDSAYDAFFEQVGTPECRDSLNAVQREALLRRAPLEKMYADYAAANGYTFSTVGSLDKAFESVVLDLVWGFWQYHLLSECSAVPDAATVSDQALFDYVDDISGWSFYTDQGLAPYTPYYYQAGTQLGAPDIALPHLKGLMRYGYQPPRSYVPRSIPMRFDSSAMRDVDRWVQRHATRMLYVYGQNDPWGAERFRLGSGARDSYVFTAPGANHGAKVAGLEPEQQAKATARILAWAGVAPRPSPRTPRRPGRWRLPTPGSTARTSGTSRTDPHATKHGPLGRTVPPGPRPAVRAFRPGQRPSPRGPSTPGEGPRPLSGPWPSHRAGPPVHPPPVGQADRPARRRAPAYRRPPAGSQAGALVVVCRAAAMTWLLRSLTVLSSFEGVAGRSPPHVPGARWRCVRRWARPAGRGPRRTSGLAHENCSGSAAGSRTIGSWKI